MDRIGQRITIVGLLLVAVAVGVAGISIARSSEAMPQTATVLTTPASHRIERDLSGQCIPNLPAVETVCDPVRLAMWENHSGEFTDFLRVLRAPVDGPTDIFTAHLRFRAEAGDLAVLRDLARQAAVADVRIVAVGLAPNEPAAEYVEVQNVGGDGARLEGMRLDSPDRSATFRFDPAFRFPGTLAPEESCRVYTRPAAQPDACAGKWDRPPSASLWPQSGASVVVRNHADAQPSFTDQWWYRP